jgi:antitoxin (DNA-binding transcriptional repressor) of toxin-antitoxin stability system
MRRTEIAELSGSLAEVLDAVRAGEEVLLYEQERPIARISPIRSGGPSPEEIAELVRSGLLRRRSDRSTQSPWRGS